MKLIDELRQKIAAKHEAALAALDTLKTYLEESPVPENGNSPTRTRASTPRKRAPKGSIRDRVLQELDDFATCRQVADRTGLSTRQVRGVINAPDIKDDVERETREEVVYYRYKGDLVKKSPGPQRARLNLLQS